MSRSLCGVQMKWSADDYRTRETFQNKVRSLVAECRAKAGAGDLLVVFPEDVGTPLMLLDAPDWVFRTGSLQTAITRLTLCHFPKVLKAKLQFGTGWVRSLALARASIAAKAYFETFSDLAAEFGVYLVAGSILLPDLVKVPKVIDKRKTRYDFMEPNVYNMTYLFDPHGNIMGSQKKVYLVPGLEDEKGFDIVNGSLSDLKVFDSPFGKLGIAICLDSFQEDVVKALANQGAEILIQPSANSKTWDKDEQEGWMKSAWTAIDTMDFSYAINPMMTGCLFDLCFEGQSSILKKGFMEKKLGYDDLPLAAYFLKLAESGNCEEVMIVPMDEI